MERETAETPPNATQKLWGLLQLCEGFFFFDQLFSALHEGDQLHTELQGRQLPDEAILDRRNVAFTYVKGSCP